MENAKGFKVWVVAGKADYEGDYLGDSGKVFLNKEDGVKYGESLVLKSFYDGYSIKECVVE